jgi:hypothetical protein
MDIKGQSRMDNPETLKSLRTRHRTRSHIQKKRTIENKKDEQLTIKPEMNPGAREGCTIYLFLSGKMDIFPFYLDVFFRISPSRRLQNLTI